MSSSHKIFDRHKISHVPPIVDCDDLEENRKILSKSDIEKLQNKPLKEGRNKKSSLDTDYDISLINGERHAIYKGAKHKKSLGKGSFGKVKLVQNLNTREWIVVKIIAFDESEHDNSVVYYNKEVQLLKEVGQYVASEIRTLPGQKYKAEIYMKLAKGISLDQLIKKNKILTVIEYIEIMISILTLNDNLLSMDILHLDLKGHNIILDIGRFETKLIDFGLATHTDKNSKEKLAKAGIGTKVYTAPEVSEGKVPRNVIYNQKSELYSQAITFTRLLDYSDMDDEGDIYFGHLINHHEPAFRKRVPNKDTRKKLQTLINAMGEANPDDRPSIKECMDTFSNIREELSAEEKIILVGCIDITDLQLNKELAKQLDTLKHMDRACIIEKHDTKLPKIDYVKYKHTLENHGLIVLDEVVRYQDTIKDMQAQVDEYLKTLANADKRLYTPYFILNEQTKKNKDQFINAGMLFCKSDNKTPSRKQLCKNALSIKPSMGNI